MEGLCLGGEGCAPQQATTLPDDGTVIQPQEGSFAPLLLGPPNRSKLLLLPSRTLRSTKVCILSIVPRRAAPVLLCPLEANVPEDIHTKSREFELSRHGTS
jgi:hypothetical protein